MDRVFEDYDEDTDVLYVTIGEPDRQALSFEDEHGLIWRKSLSGEWVGVTVPDLKYFWGGRESELQRLIWSRLPHYSIAGLVSA